jgi:hypothetical protein
MTTFFRFLAWTLIGWLNPTAWLLADDDEDLDE